MLIFKNTTHFDNTYNMHFPSFLVYFHFVWSVCIKRANETLFPYTVNELKPSQSQKNGSKAFC